MSNLVEELQKGLNSNKNLYSQIMNEEIINLIENYKEYPNEYKLYELYFNNKCKKDYMTFLLSNINNEIEKLLTKNKKEILEIKIEMLFKKYRGNLKRLIKQFKVNNEDLVKNIRELKELKQKMEMKKELKRDYKKESDRYNKIVDNLDKVVEEEFEKYFQTGEQSSFLEDYMRYLVRINKRLLNMKVSSEEYNKFLIKKLTEDDYESVEEMVDANVTYNYISGNQLPLMILKYKNIKDETLEGLILEMPEDIDSEFIKKYRELIVDNINLNDTNDREEMPEYSNSEIKYHLLIEIIETCPQPKNDRYVEYLKEIYIENDMEREYEKILEKNEDIKEMLIEFEDEELSFTKTIIKNIKNKENYQEEIMRKSLNEDMSEKEYYEMLSEFKMIENILSNEEEQYEILDSYVTTKISNRMQEIVNYNLNTTVNDLKRNLKVSNDDDEYIREQIQKYEIDRQNKKNYIYVSVNDMFLNDNVVEIFRFYKKLSNKLELLNKNKIMKDLEKIVQNTLSQILEHYLKAITHYKTLEDEDRLYYNLNEDEEIRVYVKDIVMDLFEYIVKNLNTEGEFIYKHLMKHIFEYEYYNIVLETEETIASKLDTDILMINYANKMNLLKDIFKKDYNNEDLKRLNQRLQRRMEMKMEENIYSGKKYQSFYKIVELNNRYNILSDKEISYIKKNWDDLSFLSLGNLIKGKNTEEKSLSALNFVKLFVYEIELSMKEKNINIFNENNQKEEKEQIDMAKELEKLMKGEIKIMKGIKSKVENVYINNVIDIGRKIEDIDLTELTIKKFQKMYNENTNENVKEKLIIESIKNTISMLEKLFNHKYPDTENLTKTMLEEKNKLIIISKRNTRNLDYKNIYERLSKEQKNLYDIVKFISILYYLDCMINEDMDLEKQLNINVEEPKKVKMINKKVYVIKSKKITKITKEEEQKGETLKKVYVTKEGDKLDRFDFILLDTLKNKTCKIKKGVYKGKYARIMDIKPVKYFTNKLKNMKNAEKKYYNDLIRTFNVKKQQLENTKTFVVIDKTEIDKLEKYRKSLDKKNLDPKYEFNIKINPRLRKVLNESEERLLRESRKERTKEIDYQIMIFKEKHKEIKYKNQYVVRVNEGDKNQKNIYLESDDIIINTEGLVTKEIIELVKEKRTDKRMKYVTSLYDLIKFLFEYQNLNIDNKLEYFTNIYKEGIEIYNYNKMNKMNKLLIEEKLIEKVRKIRKNIKILTKKTKEGTIKKEEKQLLDKLKRVLKIKLNELEKMKKQIEEEELRKYYNVTEIKMFKDELKIEKNIMYYEMNKKEYEKDLENIKKIKLKIKEEQEKEEKEFQIMLNKLINKFKEELYYVMREDKERNMKLIQYVRNNMLPQEEESDTESIDLDELELELDGIFEEMENSPEEEPKKERELTWLELMDLPDDYSDYDLTDEEI